MGSGCGNSIVDDPSSSGQLPVPVALNAPFPTLFAVIIHDWLEKVNTFLQKQQKMACRFCGTPTGVKLRPSQQLPQHASSARRW